MAAKYWIKFYHDVLDDPKTGKLPDNLWRRFFELCLIAGEQDLAGFLPNVEVMAWRLRMHEDTLKSELGMLAQSGFVELALDEQGKETWFVSNFAKRQHAMSNSARAKLWRETHKDKKWALPIYKSLPSTPGVYKITCTGNGMMYIGATNNMHVRIKQHLYSISKDQHPMSEDALDYGVESITVEILEHVEDESTLPEREAFWMSAFPADDLYNKRPPINNSSWTASGGENGERTFRSAGVRQDKIRKEVEVDTDTDKSRAAAALTCYENNIGQLTPIIAEKVETAVSSYGQQWVIDAIMEAVTAGVRKWNYTAAILSRWGVEGRGTNGRSPAPAPEPERIGGVY